MLITCTSYSRYYAKAECFARLCHRLGVCPSVCLSVCLSVTLVDCIKTVQARNTKFSLWATTGLSFIVTKFRAIGLNEGVKERYPLKTSFCRYWLE